MMQALVLARQAARKGEVPVGAIVVRSGKIVSKGMNLTRTDHDPSAHAEMVAIRLAAAKLGNERLTDCVLYVTLEPCAMCAGVIVQARLPLVVYGAADPNAGACGSALRVIPNKKLNHRPKVVKGILAEEAGEILRAFFRRRRGKIKAIID